MSLTSEELAELERVRDLLVRRHELSEADAQYVVNNSREEILEAIANEGYDDMSRLGLVDRLKDRVGVETPDQIQNAQDAAAARMAAAPAGSPEQAQAQQDFEAAGGDTDDLVAQIQEEERREALEANYGYMAQIHGYGSVDEMLERLRGEANAIGGELGQIAVGLGDLELMNLLTDGASLSTFGDDGALWQARVTRAPLTLETITFENAEGRVDTWQVNPVDFARVENVAGFDRLKAGALFEALGRSGWTESEGARLGGMLALYLGDQGFRDFGFADQRRRIDTVDDSSPFASFPSVESPALDQAPTPANTLNVRGAYDQDPNVDGRFRTPSRSLNPFGDPLEIFARQANRSATEFKRLTERYGKPELALVAMKDRALADEIYTHGSIQSDQSRSRMQDVLNAYGVEELQTAGFAQGYDGNEIMSAFLNVGGVSEAARSAVSQVTVPDPEQTKDTLETMYRQLLLTDPTEAQLNQFAAYIESQVIANRRLAADEVAGTVDGQPYNIFQRTGGEVITSEEGINQVLARYAVATEAQALTGIESTEAYKRLYAKRPQGVDPLTYAQAFRNELTRSVGQVAALQSLDAQRAGMETGDVDVALGRAMHSEAGATSRNQREARSRKARLLRSVI